MPFRLFRHLTPIVPGFFTGLFSFIWLVMLVAEAETPILWPSDAKSWLIGNDPDAGKDWRQEEKGMTEDEMVGWHHRLDGRDFGWTLGLGDGQGSLACCDSWGHKELDTTEQLNWTEANKAFEEQSEDRRLKYSDREKISWGQLRSSPTADSLLLESGHDYKPPQEVPRLQITF